MGINWGSVAGKLFEIVPMIIGAIQTVERNAGDLKGPDKKIAVIQMARQFLPIAEGIADRDLLDDDKVYEALEDFVDAYVSFENARISFQLAIAASKASVNREE